MLPWMASNCHAPGELPPKPAATTRAGAGATQGDAHWPTRWSQNATTRSAVLPARAVCSSWRRRRFGQARGGRSSSPTRTARPTRRPNSISYWRPDRKTGQGTTLISHFRPGRDLITPLVDSCSRGHPDDDIFRRAKSRCRQVATKAFRRWLRDLPSQPPRPCQGALQPDAVLVPEGPLRNQFGHSQGACRLSGIRRYGVPASCGQAWHKAIRAACSQAVAKPVGGSRLLQGVAKQGLPVNTVLAGINAPCSPRTG